MMVSLVYKQDGFPVNAWHDSTVIDSSRPDASGSVAGCLVKQKTGSRSGCYKTWKGFLPVFEPALFKA
ncbi:MAG TPA: hypothetical protein VND43_01020 [Burkholderiales bacterium]|nr:hypothetical protein [Burkholderiales bacterium]